MKEATFMASRIKIRLILELNASGMSQTTLPEQDICHAVP